MDTSRPFHLPGPSTPSLLSSSSSSHHLRHLQLYLLIAFSPVALAHQTFISYDSDPLLRGPVHRFTSFQNVVVLFLFLLSFALLLSDSLLPLPSDLFFALTIVVFFLHSSPASVQTSLFQVKCDSFPPFSPSSAPFSPSSSLSQPRLFVADTTLNIVIYIHDLWVLQTCLFLYVDAFIPQGCHFLLNVVSIVEMRESLYVVSRERKRRRRERVRFYYFLERESHTLTCHVRNSCVFQSFTLSFPTY